MTGLAAFHILVAGASAGGFLFSLLGVPAPWIAGSMAATVALVLAGVRAEVPRPVRDGVFLVLGLQTGAAIDWSVFEGIARWPLSLAILAVTVVAITLSGMVFFRRVHRWDGPSAFYGSVPGALTLILALAEESGARMARVSVVQSIRLICLVAALPVLIAVLAPGSIVPAVGAPAGPPADLAFACMAGAAAGYLFEWLRVPAGLLLGAALANAGLHLSGLAEGALPPLVLDPAYVLLGVLIGVRFDASSMTEVKDAAAAAMTSFPLALAVAMAGAGAAHLLAGVPLAEAVVAFAPGGLEAMIVLAFALGLDPAYVGAHQMARYLGITVAVPVAAAWLSRRWRSPPGEGGGKATVPPSSVD
jgi:membrane AbrB-like protein